MTSLNSLYTIGGDYKDVPFKYVNGFWISSIGLLALASKFQNSALVHNYLTKPQPLSDEGISLNGDNYTDFIAGVKALYDNKTMQYPTWLKFLNFFRELQSNGYKNVDTNKFIKLTKEMIQVKIRPHQIIQPTVFGFVNKKIKLEDCILPLYQFNEMYNISPNFKKMCLLHRNDIMPKKDKMIKENLSVVKDIIKNFEDYYEHGWMDIIQQQKIGDCQSIVSFIKDLNIQGMTAHFGEITIDYPTEKKYNNKTMTHHWVDYNGQILEFSKGTLKDYVDWNNMYNVYDEGELEYNSIKLL